MPPIRRTPSGSSSPSRKLAGHGSRARTERGTDEASAAPSTGTAAGSEESGTGKTARGVLDTRTRSRRARASGAATTETDGAADPSPGDRADPDAGAVGRRGRFARPLVAVGAVGLVAGIACGVVGGLMLADPQDPPIGRTVDNTAFVDTDRTGEVKAAATEDVQRLVAIDHASLDHYHDTLGEFLTPELIAELDKNWPALKQSYEQTKLKVDARVSDVGVSFLQGDRAEVLVVQDVSTTRDGQASGSTTGTYLVTLTEVDGHWKLSKIPDLPT